MKTIPKIFRRRAKERGQESSSLSHVKPCFLDRAANALENSPLVRIWVRINQSATVLAIVVATIAFGLAYIRYNEDNIKHEEDRVDKAWNIVMRMSGKQSNAGQVSAIELLVSHGVLLGEIDLHKTYLARARLKGVDFNHSNLSSVDLSGADLRNANLLGTDLSNAILVGADLSNANFEDANFSGAKLVNAKVDISIILASSLRLADITGVQFVYFDENGEEQWDGFGDTLAEAPAADNRQRLIDSACAEPKYQRPQNKALPFILRNQKCDGRFNYKRVFQ